MTSASVVVFEAVAAVNTEIDAAIAGFDGPITISNQPTDPTDAMVHRYAGPIPSHGWQRVPARLSDQDLAATIKAVAGDFRAWLARCRSDGMAVTFYGLPDCRAAAWQDGFDCSFIWSALARLESR